MRAAIELQNVTKIYRNGKKALNGLSLSIRPGEIFGFLGPNGAGKTTTIKMLLGFLSPTSGQIFLAGGDPADPVSRRRLGYLPEVANYYEFLTPEELLRFYGKLCSMGRKQLKSRIDEILELVGLQDYRKKALRQLSKGTLQRAGIAQALLHDPEILILDEPMTGLDPLGRRQIRDIMHVLRENGKTVFFSSHELSEAEVVSDRVAILNDGQMCWCGVTKEITGNGQGNLERIFLQMINQQKAVEGEQVCTAA